MTHLAPGSARQSFRHEAFLWHHASEFIALMVSFVRDGLEAGEPVLVALTPEHADWLQDALGEQAEQVEFVGIAAAGRNPARIIPTMTQFLDKSAGRSRPGAGHRGTDLARPASRGVGRVPTA